MTEMQEQLGNVFGETPKPLFTRGIQCVYNERMKTDTNVEIIPFHNIKNLLASN